MRAEFGMPLSRLAPSSEYCERCASSVIDEDVRARVQLREDLRQIRLAELVNHRHDEIGRIGRKQLLQLLDAVGHLHREADALAGLGELIFQLRAVGDEHHLPLRKLTGAGTSPAP